jgi:hypothetical protein
VRKDFPIFGSFRPIKKHKSSSRYKKKFKISNKTVGKYSRLRWWKCGIICWVGVCWHKTHTRRWEREKFSTGWRKIVKISPRTKNGHERTKEHKKELNAHKRARKLNKSRRLRREFFKCIKLGQKFQNLPLKAIELSPQQLSST